MVYLTSLILGCITPQRSVMLVFLGLVLGFWFKSRKPGTQRKLLPPSPFQLPFVGCAPFLGSLPHEAFTKWAKTLGKIYSCRLGSNLAIVLNEAELVREAFGKPVFNGRPSMYTSDRTSKGFGISFASDDTWAIHRRFALRTFKALGMGKGQMEELVTEEAGRMVDKILQFQGKPFRNKSLILNAVGNVIYGVLFGQRFENDNQANKDTFYSKINAVIKHFGPAGGLNVFPILRFVPHIRWSFGKVVDALEDAARFIAENFKSHEQCLDITGFRDFTDAFIHQRNNEIAVVGSPVLFTDQQFVGAARELFVTGYDTTTTTLRWAFLYMAKNLEAQRKVQQEIDEVVGKARYPCYADQPRMPYTQAAVYEIQRLSSIAPLGIPHRAIEETELAGYRIPKDAWIFTNIYHISRDEKVWDQADKFKPERFLNEEGTKLVIPKAFIPFSVGKRACPGEPLAKVELFLMFSAVLQQFRLRLEGKASLRPVNGITLDTEDYQLRAIARYRFNVDNTDVLVPPEKKIFFSNCSSIDPLSVTSTELCNV